MLGAAFVSNRNYSTGHHVFKHGLPFSKHVRACRHVILGPGYRLLLPLRLVELVLWLVPGLALTKSKINSGELTDKYRIFTAGEHVARTEPS